MDLNNDGFNDILSGSYSRRGAESMAGTFQVFYGEDGGTFKKPVALTGSDEEVLIIPADAERRTEKICTRPTAVDWDNDGDLDLVVGNFAGSFYLFKGDGGGGFAPQPEPIMGGDQPLAIEEQHSDPFVIDWDGDGDLDLLTGSAQGGVYWSENTAGEGETPQLTSFETLVGQAGYGAAVEPGEPTRPAAGTRIWVDDINGDGKLDLLVGDNATVITPVAGLTEEELRERKAVWDAEQETLREAAWALRNSEDVEAYRAAMIRYQEHYNDRSEFLTEERTGFVWLYLQQ